MKTLKKKLWNDFYKRFILVERVGRLTAVPTSNHNRKFKFCTCKLLKYSVVEELIKNRHYNSPSPTLVQWFAKSILVNRRQKSCVINQQCEF